MKFNPRPLRSLALIGLLDFVKEHGADDAPALQAQVAAHSVEAHTIQALGMGWLSGPNNNLESGCLCTSMLKYMNPNKGRITAAAQGQRTGEKTKNSCL